MTTLHIVYSTDWPPALERLWSEGDSLLLAGASVTLLLCQQQAHSTLTLPQPTYALADAVFARGINVNSLGLSDDNLLSSEQWVALCTAHDKTLSWS